MAGTGDVEEDRGQGVPGQVVEVAGDPAALLGHGVLGHQPGVLELLDEGLLVAQGPAQDEREHVGHGPRRPTDALLRDEDVGHPNLDRGGHHGEEAGPREGPQRPRRVEHHGGHEEERALQVAVPPPAPPSRGRSRRTARREPLAERLGLVGRHRRDQQQDLDQRAGRVSSRHRHDHHRDGQVVAAILTGRGRFGSPEVGEPAVPQLHLVEVTAAGAAVSSVPGWIPALPPRREASTVVGTGGATCPVSTTRLTSWITCLVVARSHGVTRRRGLSPAGPWPGARTAW